MNHYLFNVTNEERENILDKHKQIYDGYVTEYGGGNMTPLYVVDMAKDKGGITLNNKGEVTSYKNFGINENINEMRFDNKSTGLFSAEEDDYSNPKAEKSAKSDIKKHFNKPAKRPFHYEEDPSEDWPKHDVDYDTEFDFELQEDRFGAPLDMIADRESDVKHGTVDFDNEIQNLDLGDIIPFDDDEYEDDDSTEFSIDLTHDDSEDNNDEFSFELGFDDEDIEPIMEQVNKSLDMFKRFGKYN